jgi:uncharacterized membrane protein YsdA (DUF1294 family)/cold shock CspA family protein
MSTRKPPRYQGKVTSWKDDQGFGFISPNGGGPAVFMHISAFADQRIRPAVDDIVTYELGANEKGQPRANKLAFARDRAMPRSSPPTAVPSMIAAIGFFSFIGASVFVGKLPLLVLAIYLVSSLLAYAAYARDKSAAREGRRRTRESDLHLLALIGGWPGALLAQQTMRHKSKKEAFRNVFWLTVAANCAALVLILTLAGSNALRSILG